MKKQNIVILGATGSIGHSTLDVIERFQDRFRLIGLSAGRDAVKLNKLIHTYRPRFAAVYDRQMADKLTPSHKNTKVLSGLEGLIRLATHPDVDIVVIAITGSIALRPLLEAIKAGKRIALANKESLVVGGQFVERALRAHCRARIVPIDSEQSAIFQCLQGHDRSLVSALYLTASGGPLFHLSKRSFNSVTPRQALSHPRWNMGRKISIDSATMMNKGLEVIEAQWLFDMPLEKIKVVIHRQAVIHSLVEFIDGSILGQFGVTDMRLPIQYALSFPQRWFTNGPLRLNISKLSSLSFAEPDMRKFPCLELAYHAARRDGVLPCVLNAANEEAVEAFLNNRISFTRIPKIIEALLKRYNHVEGNQNLDSLLRLEQAVRNEARGIIQQHR